MFSLMLSCKNFIVSHFTFKSISYFEFHFVKGVKSVSTFLFFGGGVAGIIQFF